MANESSYKEVAQNENAEESETQTSLLVSYGGCLFALASAIIFPSANVIIKMGSFLNGVEHLCVFFTFKLVILLIVSSATGHNPMGKRENRRLLSLRGLVGSLAAVLFYKGIVLLPPSDCSALFHSTIVITAILSRLILNEKLDLSHILALGLTILGVTCISKPSLLFEARQHVYNWSELVGVACVLTASLFYGLVYVIIKKLCEAHSHWSVVAIYDSYFGIPISLGLVYFLIELDPFDTKRNIRAEWDYFLNHLLLSAVSAVLSVAGQVCLTLAFAYDEPTRVTIFKACDVIVAFIMQLFILNLNVDFLSLTGSVAILTGIILVLGFNWFQMKYSDKLNSKRNKKTWLKILFFKF